MKLNCLWVTAMYRGDHSADVQIAVEPDANETVEHFCERILGNDETHCDKIELRIVKESTK